MAIPDNQLDDLITLTLRTQTVVPRRQKEIAWRQLRRKTGRQIILVPYAVPPAPAQPAASLFDRIRGTIGRMLTILLTDERRYHRAAESRGFVSITSVFGSGLMIHFYLPSRYPVY
ncbi:MAG TPA: hypothetical protein VKY59_12665 [Spirillospora sp.]|nr:hypothetical protein [Spirillospora sp.]